MKTRNTMTYDMKTISHAILSIMALGLVSALGQQPTPPPPTSPPPVVAPTSAPPPGANFSERLQNIIQRASAPTAPEPSLTKFDLDFPGGTSKQLVAAIQKAMGRPLNAIVPEDVADTKLPAIKMNSVDVAQLFQALAAASRKNEAVVSSIGGFGGPRNYQYVSTSCGFRQGAEGRPTDDTIWYFYVEKPGLPPDSSPTKVCRFYSLAPYVDRGLSVDDITTAIETGWKMLWEEGTSMPTIKYHKDTKLLIAVGEASKLETIDAALKALEPSGNASGSRGLGGGIGGGRRQGPGPRTTTAPPASEEK